MDDSPVSTSAYLQQRIPSVMERWEQRVRCEVPAAAAQDPPVLRNDLPEFLEQVAAVLAEGQPAAEASTDAPRRHGTQRAGLGRYSVAQVLHEYSLLRAILLDVLEEGRTLPPAERDLILDHVEAAMRHAAEQFAASQQEALRAQEEQHRLLVENAREYAMFLTHRDRRVTSWSFGAERLLGYLEGEILGRSADVIFTPEDRERGEADKEAAIARAEGRAQNERWHLRKDGSRFWGSGIMYAVYDEAGEWVGYGKVMQDRTDHRHAEEERQRLLQALRDADLRKNEFLVMLAHEMRSPLGAMMNSLAILDQGGSQDDRVNRQRAVITRQVLQLRRLVEDLLDVSRIVQGRVELRPAVLDLRTPINYGVQTSRPLIEAREHALEVCLPADAVWIEGDPGRLEQVVTNLLNNAARYTDPGGRIFLSLAAEGGEAVLRVRDTGAGITAEMLPRIFDLFTQADPGTGAARGGLGLGLTLVKRLVELHGGGVAVASEGPGEGAEFTVRLPLRR